MATFPRRASPPQKRRVDYHVYREEVREDCHGCCVYCGVHENHWDFRDANYELDHFKPKHFDPVDVDPKKSLRNDFYNLRWCCHICNSRARKGSKWPTPEEETLGAGFVDVCNENWYEHYEVQKDGQLKSLSDKATYTIEAIGLNDEGYIRQRLRILAAGHALFKPPK